MPSLVVVDVVPDLVADDAAFVVCVVVSGVVATLLCVEVTVLLVFVSGFGVTVLFDQ